MSAGRLWRNSGLGWHGWYLGIRNRDLLFACNSLLICQPPDGGSDVVH